MTLYTNQDESFFSVESMGFCKKEIAVKIDKVQAEDHEESLGFAEPEMLERLGDSIEVFFTHNGKKHFVFVTLFENLKINLD